LAFLNSADFEKLMAGVSRKQFQKQKAAKNCFFRWKNPHCPPRTASFGFLSLSLSLFPFPQWGRGAKGYGEVQES
jgi:hypothetical protein